MQFDIPLEFNEPCTTRHGRCEYWVAAFFASAPGENGVCIVNKTCHEAPGLYMYRWEYVPPGKRALTGFKIKNCKGVFRLVFVHLGRLSILTQ